MLGTVTKDSTWHPHSSLLRSTDSSKFWCPFLWDRCQLRLGGRPAAQEPGRPGGHSHSSPHSGSLQVRTVLDRPARARGGRRGRSGAGGRANVRTERAPGRRCPALPRLPWLRAGPGPRPPHCPPSARPHWPGWEPREQEQRPYRPLFHLHLLCLLLLPPATRSVTTGSDWPGCPAKERDRGENHEK